MAARPTTNAQPDGNFDGDQKEDIESQAGLPDTLEQFLDDDLTFRTVTTLIQRLRSSTRKQLDFDFTTYKVTNNTKALSKFSFLLVRDAEVVAASPLGIHGIAVTHSMPYTEFVLSRNPRTKDVLPTRYSCFL